MLRFQGSTKVPAYRLHKASGQARVTIPGTGGGTLYLGTYGSPESRERYAEAVAAWLKGQQAPAPSRCSSGSYTVGRLVLDYVTHLQTYYRDEAGKQTSQATLERRALRLLVQQFETIECRDFGPKRLKDYQQGLAVEHGLARKTVNEYTAVVRRAFSWAVSEELVPGSVTHALREVRNLQRGRSQARETEPVRPVPRQIVDKTLPHLGSIVADVVRLQLMTGARPGEVLQLRPCDLDRSDSTRWYYTPPHHKNAFRGHSRVIAFGPQAQAIITKYLDRDPSTPCFSPAEAMAEHIAKKAEARKTPRYRSHQRRNIAKRKTRPHRSPGDAFTVASYRRAISRACQRAGVADWHPHQLRHTRLTEVETQRGLDAARAVGGHRDAKVTLRYAHIDKRVAGDIMAEIG